MTNPKSNCGNDNVLHVALVGEGNSFGNRHPVSKETLKLFKCLVAPQGLKHVKLITSLVINMFGFYCVRITSYYVKEEFRNEFAKCRLFGKCKPGHSSGSPGLIQPWSGDKRKP